MTQFVLSVQSCCHEEFLIGQIIHHDYDRGANTIDGLADVEIYGYPITREQYPSRKQGWKLSINDLLFG
jgi:hypothetical protein